MSAGYHMQNEHREVVVLGAGISGLTCAFTLQRHGVEVLVIEKSDRAGGVIQSERVDGYLIERGPNSTRGTTELLTLIEELGIEGEMLEGNPKAPAYVYFNGRMRAVPMNPVALLKCDLLSAGGKFRLLKEPFIAPRQSAEEESVADFVGRRLGGEIAERLVAPFVSGIYAGDSRRLSMQAAFPALANLESGSGSLFQGGLAKIQQAKRERKETPPQAKRKLPRSVSFRSGLGFLTETLRARLGDTLLLNTECAVRANLPDEGPGRFRLTLIREGKENFLNCDRLIIATPAHVAAGQVRPLSEEVSRCLSEVESPPLTVLHLAYEKSQVANPLDGFGLLVAPSEGLNVLGCLFSSSQFGNRAPEGMALLTVFIGGVLHTGLTQLTDEETVAVARADLDRMLGISTPPHVLSVTRWQRAIPQYNLGHAGRIKQIEAALRRIEGLHLIGNYLHGVSVGDCVKQAAQMAARLGEPGRSE